MSKRSTDKQTIVSKDQLHVQMMAHDELEPLSREQRADNTYPKFGTDTQLYSYNPYYGSTSYVVPEDSERKIDGIPFVVKRAIYQSKTDKKQEFYGIRKEMLLNVARLASLYMGVIFFIAMRIGMPNAFAGDYINPSFALKLSIMAITIWVLFTAVYNLSYRNEDLPEIPKEHQEGRRYKLLTFLTILATFVFSVGVWAAGLKAQIACAIITPFLLFALLTFSEKYSQIREEVSKEPEREKKESWEAQLMVYGASGLFFISVITPMIFFMSMSIAKPGIFHSDYLNPSFGTKMVLLTFTLFVAIQVYNDSTKYRPGVESSEMKFWKMGLFVAGLSELAVGYGVWAAGTKAQIICSIFATIGLAAIVFINKKYTFASKTQFEEEARNIKVVMGPSAPAMQN